jgi:hypothetical protein
MQPQVDAQAGDVVAPQRGGGQDGGDDPGQDPENIEKMLRMMLMRFSSSADRGGISSSADRQAKADTRASAATAGYPSDDEMVEMLHIEVVDDEMPPAAEADAAPADEVQAVEVQAVEVPAEADAAPADEVQAAEVPQAAEVQPAAFGPDPAADPPLVLVVDDETDQWTGRSICDKVYVVCADVCYIVVLFASE